MIEITRQDREAAWRHAPVMFGPKEKADWLDGKYDNYHSVIRDFAAHRIAAHAAGLAAGIAQERERCAGVAERMMYGDIAHDAETECHDDACHKIAAAIRIGQ